MKKRIKTGLIGKDIGYTLSPVIHSAAGDITGVDVAYRVMDVQENRLPDVITGLKELGFSGFNATIPYKEKILDYVDEKSDVVEFLERANTMVVKNRTIKAYNTDWKGFLSDWLEKDVGRIEGATITILGAGGAAGAVFYALAKSGVRKVNVLNRNLKRARALVKKFKYKFYNLKGGVFSINNQNSVKQCISESGFLVNTTPVGTFPRVDDSPITIDFRLPDDIAFYDLIYRPEKTALAKAFEKYGKNTYGGTGMLIHQAALSFEIWTGILPDTGKLKSLIFMPPENNGQASGYTL